MLIGVNSPSNRPALRLRLHLHLLILQTIDVKLHQVSKQHLTLSVQVLRQQRHLRQLVLDLFPLVPEFLEEDIVAESGDDLEDLLLGHSRVLLLQLGLQLLEHSVADEEELLLDDPAQLALGDASQRSRSKGPLTQLLNSPLPETLQVLKHLIPLLHLLQILHCQTVLLQDLDPARLHQLLHIHLVASNQVDVLLLIDLPDQSSACMAGGVRLRISRVQRKYSSTIMSGESKYSYSTVGPLAEICEITARSCSSLSKQNSEQFEWTVRIWGYQTDSADSLRAGGGWGGGGALRMRQRRQEAPRVAAAAAVHRSFLFYHSIMIIGQVDHRAAGGTAIRLEMSYIQASILLFQLELHPPSDSHRLSTTPATPLTNSHLNPANTSYFS